MGDSYRPGGGGREDPRRRDFDDYNRDSGFSFRGAAHDSYRPQEQFSFRAPQQAPRFPQEQPPDRPRRQTQNRTDRKRSAPFKPKRHGGQPFRRPGRAAHERDLLKRSNRETTPEQLAGMNAEHTQKYAEYISDSDDDDSESDSDSSNERDEDRAEGSSRKRAKTDQNPEDARPKWSNPDPYSVLPPTDMGIGPKKDIVQVIRKSKLDASAQNTSTNAVKENADFISFDFGDDEEEEDEEDGEIEIDDGVGPPHPPPDGFVMPTDQELMEQYAQDTRGSKRKRAFESVSNDIVTEWQPFPGGNATPWQSDNPQFLSNVGLQLHKEIVDFYDFVRPLRHEEDIRYDVIDRIEDAVRRFSPTSRSVEVKSFGSFAAGLYLPVADMDLVAVSQEYLRRGRKTFAQNKKEMYKLSNFLLSNDIARRGSMLVIAKSKVPILKFVDDLTGVKVDISFENDSGIKAIKTFHDWKEIYPEMPILVMIIKQFVAMRGLNEVNTGGIGGFTTICLVVSRLQLMPQRLRRDSDPESRFANLLMDFMDYYGNKFNLRTTGITMNPPGQFDKIRGPCSVKRINPVGLTIVDPNRPDNDISGGSRQIEQVFKHFRNAHTALQKRAEQISKGTSTDKSILGCILGGNYTSFSDARARLDRLGRDRARSPAFQPRSRDDYSYAPPPRSQYPQTANYQRPLPPPASTYQSYQPSQSYHPSQNYPPTQAYQPSQSYYDLPPPMPASYTQPVPQQYSSLPQRHHSLAQRPHQAATDNQQPGFQAMNPTAPPSKKAKKSKKEKKENKEKKEKKKKNKVPKIASTEHAGPAQKTTRGGKRRNKNKKDALDNGQA